MKRSTFLVLLLVILIFTFEGCRPQTVGDTFAKYMEEEFDHRVSGRYWVIDLNGCGSCNESLLASLQADSVGVDSTKLVLTGKAKQISYYSEKLHRYQIFADPDRKIYDVMREFKSFKLPVKIEY